jgi:hypothetical protein
MDIPPLVTCVYPARATIPGFAAPMRERGSGLKAAVRYSANQEKKQ